MIGEKALKIRPTNPPVFLEVNGIVRMKRIDMYIYIGHDRGLFCERDDGSPRLTSYTMLPFLSASR